MIGIPMLLLSLCLLAGCSHKVILTAETYTLEAGTELPESPETYASFANAELAAEAIVQADQVDTGKVGTYEAAVVLNGKAYPFAVEVVDTRAPEGSLGDWFVLSNEAVMSDSFLSECTDASEITIGFRNIELMKGQEELAALFQQELTYQEDFLISDFLGLSWEFEKDSWEEQGTELDNLEETFEAEKDGLYSLELVAADEYGNASVIRCYALIDRTAPILSGVEDTEIALNRNTDVDTLTTDGVSAEDNLLGDITASILIEEEILESSDTHLKAKVIYTVTDLCGNVATAERVMEMAPEKQGVSEISVVADGFDRARAEKVFALSNQQRIENGVTSVSWDEELYEVACMRAKELLANYSHIRLETGTTVMEEFGIWENLNRLWGDVSPEATVNSWMNSENHRNNLLRSTHTKTAVACIQAGRYCYYVQLFI